VVMMGLFAGECIALGQSRVDMGIVMRIGHV